MQYHVWERLYDRAVQGLPLLGTPSDVVERFTRDYESLDTTGDHLITFYTSLGGATGFLFGLPGYLALPVTVPANIAGVALLQLHMTAAFAAMAGEDVHSPATRDRCLDCVLHKVVEDGTNSEEEAVARRTGIKLMERGIRFLTEQSVRFGGSTIRRWAIRRIGGRSLPLVGGLLGATSDGYMTRHVGHCAKETFLVTPVALLADTNNNGNS